jgi:flagellin
MEGFIMSSNTVVRTNGMSNVAHTALKAQGNALNKASQRLATGKKVNSAADDAAGLAISDKMTAQIKGLDMASKNTEDGVSLIQTAESNVAEIDNMVQRIRELAVQSANGTNEEDADRELIQKEVDQLSQEIDAMASRASFNKLDLNQSTKVTFQVGANKGETVSLQLQEINCSGISLSAADVSTQANAQTQIGICDTALKKVEEYRATLGAMQNRLEYTDSNLQATSNNLQDARSGREDADMGTEMSNFTSANVLQQAATSMLAQANQSTQNILSLLQ